MNSRIRRARVITCLAMLLSICPGFGIAQAAGNPALQYWQAFVLLNELSQSDRAILADPASVRDFSAAAELTAKRQPVIHLLRKAAASRSECDWGLEWEAGPNMLMAHAAPSQTLARLGCLQAAVEFHDQQTLGGCETALAALVLGRHMGSDLSLNSVLIQFAIELMFARTCADNFSAVHEKAGVIKRGIAHAQQSSFGESS